MKIWSQDIQPNQSIDSVFAFGKYNERTHVELSKNINPHIQWENEPQGTQSFVLICHDSQVPTVGDNVNQEGKTVPKDLPRCDFYHWLLVDIPTSIHEIKRGAQSGGIVPKGKPGPQAPHGLKHGGNDYTSWFEGDPDMGGFYYGYDGPCPPWNDERIHEYYFTLYALDIPQLKVGDKFRGPEVLKAMDGHILDKASFMATYAINPHAS